MKKLIFPFAATTILGLYFLALYTGNKREAALLQTVTLNAGDGAFHPEGVRSVLEEKAASISNRFHLGFRHLRAVAQEERTTPTEEGRYFVGWDIRPSTEKHIYMLITYAGTNLAETTNGAWVFAPATRTAHVRLND